MHARWTEWLNRFDWPALLSEWGLRALAGLFLLYLGTRLSRRLSRFSESALQRAGMDPTASMFLRKLVYIGLLVVVILAVLQLFNIPVSSAFAVLGAAGLAIGLALKDSLSNVASGVGLVTLRPFKVGDVVTIAEITGKVESVSIFQTVLRAADNQTVTLPNSLITTAPIVNHTPDVMRRVELVIGIDYGDDIELARRTALDIIHADERILAEPAPDVLVYALAESSVDLGIRCHVANDDFFMTKCELQEKIKLAFDAAGIRIPYPQREMHLHLRSENDPVPEPGKALAR
jgi:small conductance mechanosensitive channel